MATEGPYWVMTHHLLKQGAAKLPVAKHASEPGHSFSTIPENQTQHGGGH